MKIALFIILFAYGLVSAQTSTPPDNLKPLRFFVGMWTGTGKGEAGDSKVEREYKFVLNNRFLQATYRSIYPHQTKNQKAKIVHEDFGFFSYDKARKQFVFRQFYVEDFVIQYVVSSISDDGKTIILDSESVENIPKTMRSRVTYKILNGNEFTDTYEIAEPDKDFVVYRVKHFKRQKR